MTTKQLGGAMAHAKEKREYEVYSMNYSRLGDKLVFTGSRRSGAVRLARAEREEVLFAILELGLEVPGDAQLQVWPSGHLSVRDGERRYYELVAQ